MDQEVQRKVIITESGQQIPVQMPINASGGVIVPDDSIKDEIMLDVTEKEFNTMQRQAMKNGIPRTTLLKKRRAN